ncbi:Lipoyl synthase [Anaerohalosphaera lusitana]|uniref:Lipoyl synthase n=1 Tax=Anaerohalosphaera lusitana TaxID=1936003 RepID=A0A1U9NLM7_9BACT|nr:lipoyl synthase [Anaerohalosphaera lusitana]AQT68396.1 Lipoyl synthase [Anaerohalosphaera lusitana]
MKNRGKLPVWLKRRMPASATYGDTRNTLKDLELETICTNANCPNRGQCWDRGTATVLILGNVCTRNCKFCSVGHGKPEPPAADEPDRIAEMSKRMGVKYLVITSVDRDDLPDGGAGHFAAVVNRCRELNDGMQFELLTGDFRDSMDESIEILGTALPFVFSHNVETVPSLYTKARPGGNYERSLDLLRKFKNRFSDTPTKSSMMFGLGETDEEVIEVLKDLRSVGVDRVAMGQYLKPSKESLDVVEYVEPAKFDWWGEKAKELGFSWVMSSPFTRSSYHAELERTDQ